MSTSEAHIVFVSGLSGSGKSTAMAALEDQDFYCVDNLPPQLIPQFLDLCTKATPPIQRMALAVDAREGHFLSRVPEVVTGLRGQGARVEVVFLECDNETLVNRYRETRRVHPQSPSGSVEEGIELERRLLMDVAALADLSIDTSHLNVHELKESVVRSVSGSHRRMVVNVLSFGFRYGVPTSAELVFDLRFLPNPYFVEGLRERTGEDPEVAKYVLEGDQGQETFQRLRDLVAYLLPLYEREGKAYLTIGFGCTGGRHRSVAFANALAEGLAAPDREVNVEHRDSERRE